MTRLWQQAGHDVRAGGRDDSVADVAAHGDVVLLAVNAEAVEDVLRAAGPLDGKVLIDATNDIDAKFGSLAARVAELAPDAKVVKAFNATFAPVFDAAAQLNPPANLVFCGDDEGAKETVAGLIRGIGMTPVDVGGLDQAANVEAFARLNISLAYGQGRGHRSTASTPRTAESGRASRTSGAWSATSNSRGTSNPRVQRSGTLWWRRGAARVRPPGVMLANADVMAFVARADLGRARGFYEGVLGLPVLEDDGLALAFEAHGTMLRVTGVRELTPPPYTVLGWSVPDIAATVGEFEARGVALARYAGFEQDEQGIWTAPTGARVAWFTDPDGNTLQLTQLPR